MSFPRIQVRVSAGFFRLKSGGFLRVFPSEVRRVPAAKIDGLSAAKRLVYDTFPYSSISFFFSPFFLSFLPFLITSF